MPVFVWNIILQSVLIKKGVFLGILNIDSKEMNYIYVPINL